MNWSIDSIRDALEAKLKTLTGWANIVFYGVINNILYAISYILSKFVYYVDFLAKESTWSLMTTRESALDRVDLLSYVPYRKSGSVGTVEISADETFSSVYVYTGNQVSIPKWTIFSDENNEYSIYSTDSNIYSTNYVGSIEVPVKEGIPKTFTYIATGEDDETISLFSDSIDNDEIEVFLVDVDDNVLETYDIVEKNELYFLDSPTLYICEIYTARGFQSVKIKFGNNVNAKRLNSGDRILIKYAETQGASVEITAIGAITAFQDTITDIYGNEVELFVSNNSSITGGRDIESLESIKRNAPKVFNTINGVNTKEQYQALLDQSGLVLKSVVWSLDDLGTPDISEDMNKVFIAGISPDTMLNLTSTEQNYITMNILKEKKSPIEIVSWQSADILYPRLVISAKITNRPFSEVQSQANTALDGIFGIENVEFNTSVYDSDVIQVLKGITSIKIVEPSLFYLEKSWSLSESERVILVSNTTGTNEEKKLLVDDSFSLWLKRKIAGVWYPPFQIAESSGVAISGINGFTISSGLIEYATNKITYLVNELADVITYGAPDPIDTEPLGYILSASYKTEDGTGAFINSLRLNSFKEITDLDEEYVEYSLSYINS